MHDSALVCMCQRIGNLGAIADYGFGPQTISGNHGGQGAALDKLHRDVGLAVNIANFINRANVRMIQG